MASKTSTPESAELTAEETLLAEVARLKAELAASKTAPRKSRSTATPLTADEAEAASLTARPAVAPCLCGCGETTKGRFFPGHDAVHKARLIATMRSDDEAASAFATDALVTYGWLPEEADEAEAAEAA
jgi:hypothetical protein